MCLLTFLPADVMPDTRALLNGAIVNDDGHGFAVVADDRLITRRGMHAEAMVEAFAVARHAHPHGPALFHSRLSTHGKRTIDNCHPFPVGGDERTVIAHNGILPPIVQPGKGDPRSDTRIAAEDFIPAFGSLRSRRVRLRLQQWMTRHNKMVILTVDRRFRQRAYILNEKAGIWDGGIWYSNDGYLPPRYGRWELLDQFGSDWASGHWGPFDSDDGRDEYVFGRCGFCRAMLDTTDSECRFCGWCLDCGEMPEDCQCYSPAALDAHPRG